MARRILLADDSVTAQNMGRRILTDAGYEVVTVNNGSAALKKIAENKPDLIVLDVYMPGYGGLEVCQRVKESSETRQIPVLLTVGKLEPFKGEEARRVGADAFIIKPFEATELLTVLSKLEDKIVAQPQPGKSGRFAKALASVHLSDPGDRFGDKETGWKNRLTIPSKRAVEEAPEVIALTPRSEEPAKPAESTQEFERPIPAGLPGDITPEEIAAITAAAATFSGKTEPQAEISETTAAVPAVSQDAAPTEAVAAVSSGVDAPAEAAAPEAIQQVQAPAPAETISEVVAGTEGDKAEDHPPEVQPDAGQTSGIQPSPIQEAGFEQAGVGQAEPQETGHQAIEHQGTELQAAQVPPAQVQAGTSVDGAGLPALETATEVPTRSDTVAAKPAQPPVGDDEVMAAIAALAPTNGHAIGGHQPEAHGSNGTSPQVSSSLAGVAVSGEILAGPRWIAESVAVAVEESKLALDQEMEQANAARAAAATEAVSASAVTMVDPAVVAEVSVGEIKAVETSNIETKAIESEVIESAAVGAPAIEESQLPAVSEESAYAAAAGAEQSKPVEAVSATIAGPESRASAAAEVAPPREAELAAAWQNWKQVRESLASSQPASSQPPAARAEAPEELDIKHEEAAASPQSSSAGPIAEPVEAEEDVSDAPEESTAIASIVDNMLAELRPKLVAEIAKKMNSEKKEKEKEKEKKKKR